MTAQPQEQWPTSSRDRGAHDAAVVLERHWDEALYPVDPFAIARSLGIKVFRGDLPRNVSGMIRKIEDTVEMYIDTDESPRRQRFTAAHELGHFYERWRAGKLDEPFVELRDAVSGMGQSGAEIYANAFAATLLMPAPIVRKLHRQGFQAWEMAQFFDVSPQSAEFRLANLGLAR